MHKQIGSVVLYLDKRQQAVMERYAKKEGISLDAACVVAAYIGVDAITQEMEQKKEQSDV